MFFKGAFKIALRGLFLEVMENYLQVSLSPEKVNVKNFI
jgi:hypothetical protein